MGCSFLFAVFDSHDHIALGRRGRGHRHRRLPRQGRCPSASSSSPASRPSPGRPASSGCRRARAGSTATARRSSASSSAPRGLGYEFKAGLELEWFIGQDSDEPVAAHRGPVYSPNAMLDVSEFLSELLADLDDNGLGIGQIHAEYAWSQLELSLDAKDPRRGGRRPAARARDDSHGRARQRAAGVVRAARSRPRASATAGTSTSRSTRTAATCCRAATARRA